MFVNNAGQYFPVLETELSNAKNRMYGRIGQIPIEQEETFMGISTRLTGRVTSSTVSSVISQGIHSVERLFQVTVNCSGGGVHTVERHYLNTDHTWKYRFLVYVLKGLY